MSRSRKKPYDFICVVSRGEQKQYKRLHHRMLRAHSRDFLKQLTEDPEREDLPLSLWTRKTEGIDTYCFPGDGPQIYLGKYKEDPDFSYIYYESIRK